MEIDREVADCFQDRLILAIGMAAKDNLSVDESAGALTLFLDQAIHIACDLCNYKIDKDDGKYIRKKAYRFILDEIERHAANSN